MTKVPRPEEPVDQWCNQFKPSFLIQGLLDTFTSQESSCEGSYDNCCFTCKQTGDRTRATRACADCDVMLCDRCSKIHTSTPSSADHEVSPLSGDSRPQRKRKVMCTEHDCDFEFYCRKCNKAVCCKCCGLYHKKCDSIVTIASMLKEMKEVVQKSRSQICSNLQSIQSNLKDKRSQVSQHNKQRSSLQKEIRKLSQDAVGLIKQNEKKLLKELDTVTEKQTGQLRGQIQAGEADVEACQQYTELITHILQSKNILDLCGMYQACQSGEITSAVPRFLFMEKRVPPASFKKEVGSSQTEKSFNLGHLVSDHMFSCLPRKTYEVSSKSDQDKLTPKLIGMAVVEVYGIQVIAVVDTENRQIKSIFQGGGRLYVKSIQLDPGYLYMTKFSSDSILLSFTSRRGFLKVQLTPEPVRGGSITTRKDYVSLAAVDDKTLAALCASPSSIDILDLKGRVLKTITSPLSEEELHHFCFHMSPTRDGNIWLMNGVMGSMYCITQQGIAVYEHQLTQWSSGLCNNIAVAQTGSVFVVDDFLNKIIQLTETGEYVRDVLTERDGIDNPTGLWLYRNQLLVAMLGGVVRVFEFTV